MRKVFLIAAIAALGIAMLSCNSKKGTIIPSTTSISGDLDGCFEVIDREYSAESFWSIEVKRTDKELPADLRDIDFKDIGTYQNDEVRCHVGFGIDMFDEKGNVVYTTRPDRYLDDYNYDAVELLKLKEGETGYLRWSYVSNIDQDLGKGKWPLTFKLISMYELCEPKEASIAEVSSYSDLSSSDANEVIDDIDDIDDWLNDLEEDVNFYLETKRYYASEGTDQTGVQEDLNDALETLLDGASLVKKMNASQLAKYNSLKSKIK